MEFGWVRTRQQMMLRNNKRVQMYVFNQHLDLITSHLMGPPGLTAADTLAFVLKENIDLVQQMTEPHLNSFVQLVHTHGRLPRFMNLLCQVPKLRFASNLWSGGPCMLFAAVGMERTWQSEWKAALSIVISK